jgi:hypothetical protein
MDKETAKQMLHGLVAAKKVHIIRHEHEIEALNLDKLMATGNALNIFDNYDEAMFAFISKCLAEGKEIAIQAVGPTKVNVYAAHELWRVRPAGVPAPIKATQSTSPPQQKTGGCFIATAACGVASAPEVVLLAAFRDDVLIGNPLGRAFVRTYYAVSPTFATLIARSTALRHVTMWLMVRPAAWLVAAYRRREYR